MPEKEKWWTAIRGKSKYSPLNDLDFFSIKFRERHIRTERVSTREKLQFGETVSFLGHKYFLQFWVPLLTVALSVFLRYVSRNDRHRAFRKEDLAIGLDLALTAVVLFVTTSSQIAGALLAEPGNKLMVDKSVAIPWILFLFLFGIWCLSTVVRKLGWKSDDEMHWIFGIIIPNFLGLFALLAVVNWMR